MNAQASFDYSTLASSNELGYDVDESSFTNDTMALIPMDDFSHPWEVQPHMAPSDMNHADLEEYGGEPYFGYPGSSGFGHIPTINQLHGNGDMTGAFVNTLKGQSQPATADPAYAQLRDDAYLRDQVDMWSTDPFDPGLPPARLSKSPSQSNTSALGDKEDAMTSTQAAPTATPAPTPQIEEIEVDIVIGTIRLSGDIMCRHADCGQPFGRLAELKRHYATAHAVQKPEYWCSQPLCDRSMAGGRPFHRKDKKREHEKKVHHRGIYRTRG